MAVSRPSANPTNHPTPATMKSYALCFVAALSTCALSAAAPKPAAPKPAAPKADAAKLEAPKAEPFGKTTDGTAVEVYTLTNSKGLKLRAMTYGAIVLSLETPDRDGKLADIALGYNTLDEYIKDTPYFGAIVGRYGNRIANGKFSLDGKEYTLATNNENGGIKTSLHGGLKGFGPAHFGIGPDSAA